MGRDAFLLVNLNEKHFNVISWDEFYVCRCNGIGLKSK